MVFSATTSNGVLIWDEVSGLTGPPLELLQILVRLDGSSLVVDGTGLPLVLEESNQYAVVWAISQILPEAVLAGDTPDFDDRAGIEPAGTIY